MDSLDKFRALVKTSKTNSSNGLMTLFSISAVISMSAILAATFFGIRTIYTQNVVEIAAQQSVSVSEALFIQEREYLVAGEGMHATTLRVEPEDYDRLDKKMHDYLRPFDIVKIKVISKQMEIIYSTDSSIVGMVDANNSRLRIALNGGVDAKLKTKDKMVDLAEEARFDIDVVETYVPMTSLAGDIVGCVEIYMDVTRYRERLNELLSSSMKVISLVLFGVFGVLFVVMRRGTTRLAQYEKQLHALATTDVLTGIANRRSLLNRADEEFYRVRRVSRTVKRPENVGCILLDLDHFKRINDTHGHQVGDYVLRDVAKRFVRCVRRYDIVGRYGGEEFLIISPNSDFDDIKKIAKRVWYEVRSQPFVIGNISIDVTISVGFACIEQSDENINDVIKRADDSLYRAKEAGRDQIVWPASKEAA